MPKNVLVLDTSVFCCWLNIPGKDSAGPTNDRWDYDRIASLLDEERAKGSFFVLPIATLIETGNHVVNSNGDRFSLATSLVEHLNAAVSAESPWAAFADQSSLWEQSALEKLASEWPGLAAARMTIGDATIKSVAEYYALAGFSVQILTGDRGLKAYEPTQPVAIPRRRQ